MKRFLYNTVTFTLFLILLPFLPFLFLFSKKRRANMLHRLGWIHLISDKKPNTKRIWIHALSVGEVKSALPLINAIKAKYFNMLDINYELIITASTKTGFDMATELFLGSKSAISDGVQVGYFPFDFSFSVKSISSKIEPDLVIIVESDLWPQFLWYMNRKKIPVFLVNARLSQSSFNGYRRFSTIFAPIFCMFEKIMVQTEMDKERFLKIGVPENRVVVTGNIKFDQPIPSKDTINKSLELLGNLKNFDKRYIIAGSTHEGEEEIIASIFKDLKKNLDFSNISLIIAPRDPKRASDINKMFNAKGFKSRLVSDKKGSIAEIDVVVVDKMGILASLYSICDIAFVGGSLVPFRGHNPLEPALFSKPVVFGQYTDDFKEITETMLSNNAAFRVKDKNDLLETIFMLLKDKELASRVGQNGYNLVIDGRGAVDRVLSLIKRLSVIPLKNSI
ncbi:MAG: 3-deoxy-D-manno-octulosonic acid transferase [Desulfamplus sp.]|nr:3-deoxy-D-manno-octulosonic acid transferase [Desulfamplus sp.]